VDVIAVVIVAAVVSGNDTVGVGVSDMGATIWRARR